MQRSVFFDAVMPLTLHHVRGHPHVTDAYRVKYEGREIGSVGLRIATSDRSYWAWGLDTILPKQEFPTTGQADSREDAMTAFRGMWERFAGEPDRLADFLAEVKR